MKKTSLKFLIATVLFFSILSCNIQKQVKQFSKKVNLTKYERIELTGSPTINLINSNNKYIDISADERIIDYINVINEKGVLKIFVDEDIYKEKCSSKSIFTNENYCEININIPLNKNLNMISLEGNGDVIFQTEFITTSNISFYLKGNGDIQSKKLVKANNIYVELQENGDIDLFNLDAKKIDVKLIGKGDIILEGKCIDFVAYVDKLGDIHAQNLSFETKKETQMNGGLLKTD